MQPPAMPPLHWFLRLLRALLLLGLLLVLFALLGIGLLSWGFYHTGQIRQRELQAERRRQGLQQAAKSTQPRSTRPLTH